MISRRIRHLPYLPKRRCEADIIDEGKKGRVLYAEASKKPVDFKCMNAAKFELDGKVLCKRHAETAALMELLV